MVACNERVRLAKTGVVPRFDEEENFGELLHFQSLAKESGREILNYLAIC